MTGALRAALVDALAAEEHAARCPTCCVVMFPRYKVAHYGVPPWQPGQVWSTEAVAWSRADVAWQAAGCPEDRRPPLPETVTWYTPCPDCRGTGLSPTIARPLADVLARVDAMAAENAALREAAGALVDTLASAGGGRQCSTCYSLATVSDPLPHGGAVFHCDRHASLPSTGWEDEPMESHPTRAAAPLRALRAMLARMS